MSKNPDSKPARRKEIEPTGVAEIDRLATLSPCTIQDYVVGVSAYVRHGSAIAAGPKKAAQIRLSNALARSLADELGARLPKLRETLVTHERKVAGGLRTANADVSESHSLDGLRLAVELKPINLAVGRALWNRFGDIRTFAVNIHLKFPFAVVGGVLVIPSLEEAETKAATRAQAIEEANAAGELGPEAFAAVETSQGMAEAQSDEVVAEVQWKSTLHLIDRAIERLIRAGGRRSEAEPNHLLEAIAVVVYDPRTGTLDADRPPPTSGLRWEDFIKTIVTSYSARFEA